MKRYINALLIACMGMFVLAACTSELNDAEDLPTDVSLAGAHGQGYALIGSSNFHALEIRNKLDSDITGCRTCHGIDYNGARTGQSCNASGCHNVDRGGPEDCALCHGDQMTRKIYPQEHPAHATHLEGGQGSSVTIACGDCHDLPANYEAPGHVLADNTPGRAEVQLMNALASTQTLGTVGTPSYDPASGTCANTYCHGNFTNGNNVAVAWGGDDQAACGSCHGQGEGNPLPGGTHPQRETCSGCHSGVVDADRNIIDKSLHINGKLNVFGRERTDW